MHRSALVLMPLSLTLCSAALTPLEGLIVAEKKAKEDAVAAKTTVEKKARDFVNEQKYTIELLTKEKVSKHNCWCHNYGNNTASIE